MRFPCRFYRRRTAFPVRSLEWSRFGSFFLDEWCSSFHIRLCHAQCSTLPLSGFIKKEIQGYLACRKLQGYLETVPIPL